MTDFVELLEAQLVDAHPRRSRRRPVAPSRRVAGGALAAVAAAAAVVALTVGLATPEAERASTGVATTPAPAGSAPAPATAPVAPPSKFPVVVAVLNATREPGVARTEADRLAKAGYKIGVVTDARGGQRKRSVVYYAPAARPSALVIARRERIPRVDAIGPAIRHAVGSDANVVVVVGADRPH
jgi:hypothetical protein